MRRISNAFQFQNHVSIPIKQFPIPNVYIYLNFIALAIRARRSSIVKLVPFPYVGPSVVVGTEDDEESVNDPEGSVVPVPLGLPVILPDELPIVEEEPPSTLHVVEGLPVVLEGESPPEAEVLGAEPEDEAEVLGVESMEPVALGEELVESD